MSFPADIMATGTRGLIRQLVENDMVDVVVTTCGTLDPDIARILADYYHGYFAMDEEKSFKIDARRNKYLGQWASKILSYNTDQEKEYIQSLIKEDFTEAGDQDVFRKLKKDLEKFNISEDEIKKKMEEYTNKAKSEIN